MTTRPADARFLPDRNWPLVAAGAVLVKALLGRRLSASR
jgi:hypothetical protein